MDPIVAVVMVKSIIAGMMAGLGNAEARLATAVISRSERYAVDAGKDAGPPFYRRRPR